MVKQCAFKKEIRQYAKLNNLTYAQAREILYDENYSENKTKNSDISNGVAFSDDVMRRAVLQHSEASSRGIPLYYEDEDGSQWPILTAEDEQQHPVLIDLELAKLIKSAQESDPEGSKYFFAESTEEDVRRVLDEQGIYEARRTFQRMLMNTDGGDTEGFKNLIMDLGNWIRLGMNFAVIGRTASGKTIMLSALSNFYTANTPIRSNAPCLFAVERDGTLRLDPRKVKSINTYKTYLDATDDKVKLSWMDILQRAEKHDNSENVIILDDCPVYDNNDFGKFIELLANGRTGAFSMHTTRSSHFDSSENHLGTAVKMVEKELNLSKSDAVKLFSNAIDFVIEMSKDENGVNFGENYISKVYEISPDDNGELEYNVIWEMNESRAGEVLAGHDGVKLKIGAYEKVGQMNPYRLLKHNFKNVNYLGWTNLLNATGVYEVHNTNDSVWPPSDGGLTF